MSTLGITLGRELDLSLGEKHTHPDIVVGRQYLVLLHGQWSLGHFGNNWYGLDFWPSQGHTKYQYDTPGSNGILSAWERVVEVYLAPSMYITEYTGYKPPEKKRSRCDCCGQETCCDDEGLLG